jgi:hypothetical protein
VGIGLEEVMTYRVTTDGPLEPTRGSPPGTRQFWAGTDAEIEGPEISAVLAYAGGDWRRSRATVAGREHLVARGRILGTGRVEYTIYRLT